MAINSGTIPTFLLYLANLVVLNILPGTIISIHQHDENPTIATDDHEYSWSSKLPFLDKNKSSAPISMDYFSNHLDVKGPVRIREDEVIDVMYDHQDTSTYYTSIREHQ